MWPAPVCEWRAECRRTNGKLETPVSNFDKDVFSIPTVSTGGDLWTARENSKRET